MGVFCLSGTGKKWKIFLKIIGKESRKKSHGWWESIRFLIFLFLSGHQPSCYILFLKDILALSQPPPVISIIFFKYPTLNHLTCLSLICVNYLENLKKIRFFP